MSAAAPATSDAHKLFFIGPNKTGTRSWAALLHLLGLRVAHDAAWGRATHTKDLSFFDRADAFCDGDDFDVEWLATAFPAAKFVFNTRPLLPWLTSRVFHAEDSVHAFLGGGREPICMLAYSFPFSPDAGGWTSFADSFGEQVDADGWAAATACGSSARRWARSRPRWASRRPTSGSCSAR